MMHEKEADISTNRLQDCGQTRDMAHKNKVRS